MTGDGGVRGVGLPADGPAVVAVGGGHGLSKTLSAARRYAGRITAVVSVADDGGSTGRLRAATPVPAPGDLRKCLHALAAPGPLGDALDYRFGGGDVEGHAFGNLMIAALSDTMGDVVAALDELVRLTGGVGRVLPTATERLTLVGELADGRTVEGQVAVMKSHGVRSVRVVPERPDTPGCALDAIRSADQLLLGPGSLYTSVLAAVAVPAVGDAVRSRADRTVYLANLRPQVPETEGYALGDHLEALARHGVTPRVVVADRRAAAGIDGRGAVADGDVVAGVRVVVADLADATGYAHDPACLAAVLASLA